MALTWAVIEWVCYVGGIGGAGARWADALPQVLHAAGVSLGLAQAAFRVFPVDVRSQSGPLRLNTTVQRQSSRPSTKVPFR